MMVSPASVPSQWPACTARRHRALRFVLSTASTPLMTVWCCTTRTSVSVAVTASTHVRLVRRNSPRQGLSAHEARWTNALSVRVDRNRRIPARNSASTAETVWQKASCLYVLRCAQRKPFLEAMVTRSRISSASGSCTAARVRFSGVGVLPTTSRV